MKSKLFILSISFVCAFSLSCSREKTSPPPATTAAPSTSLRVKSLAGAKVFIQEPANAAQVENPVRVKFGIQGIALAPAGVMIENSGHHHLLIDTEVPADLNQPLPATDNIIHFGKAQTETQITLAPGEHSLQLVLAGGNHVPNDPAVISEKIKIIVR